MKRSLWILVGITLVLCIWMAGCTQPSQEQTTPAPTTMPVTTAATSVPTSATQGPPPTAGYIEGPLPSQYSVEVQVDRNRVAITPNITVTFRGGKGINFVHSMDVVVSRSDGRIVTGSLYKPQVNDYLELEGTRGTDNVEVFINLITGDRYRVYNNPEAFRSYN